MVEPYIGEIRIFTGNFAPQNWAFCNGVATSVQMNEALYVLLGTSYGGTADVSFNLPDLKGRVPLGAGQGTGLSNYVLSQAGGSREITLTKNNLPAHSHAVTASIIPATTRDTRNTAFAAPVAPVVSYFNNPPVGSVHQLSDSSVMPSAPDHALPHPNEMPTLVLNYIIALYGIFPSRT